MSLINRAFFLGFIPGFASFHRFAISRLKPFLFAALVIRVSRSGPLSPSLFSLLFRAWREGKREKGKRRTVGGNERRGRVRRAERERERDHADCFSQTKTAELRTRREGQGRDVSRGLGKQERFVIPTPLDIFILPPMQIFISRTKTCAALPFSFFVVA